MSDDEPFDDAEDTVPYLPPLASYRIQAVWGSVILAEPHIYPDEILDADDLDADEQTHG